MNYVELLAQRLIDKIHLARNWNTNDEHGKGSCYDCLYHKPYSGFTWYSGNSIAHACYSTLSQMLYEAPKKGVVGLVNWTNLTQNEERTPLTHKFFDFLTGDESPYLEYKHWLFPSDPRFVKTSIGEVDINSKEFRLAYGFVVDDTTIPTRLFVDYFKAQRMIGEHVEHLKIWDKLIDQGIPKRDAFFWCQILKLNVKDSYFIEGVWHKPLDYYRGWDEAFYRMSKGKILKSQIGKSIMEDASYQDVSKIWGNSELLQSEFISKYNEYKSPFTFKELVTFVKEASVKLHETFKDI